MADYKVVDAQQLDGDLTVLADAIRERAGSEGKMAFPHGMAQMVKSIPTGGVELPTLENPVTEAEVFLGKEYIDGNGQMATGSFTIDNELTEQDDLILQISNALRNKAAATDPSTLPPLENPAGAADIVSGKALYDSDGNVIPGSLYEVLEGKTIAATEFVRLLEDGNGDINTWATQNTGDAVVRNNAIFRTVAPASAFGDATPDQVVKGATFTSAAGLLVEGTKEASSSDGLAVTKGNTSSPTIETGLSSIDYFVLMATDFSRAGLMQLLYRKPNNAISYILCTSYSYSTMKTELNHASMASSTLFTIDGGTVTWNGTRTSAFMSGESYMWLAFGTA